MELVQHADKPELTVKIGGRDYDFGEIPIESFAELQAWLNKNVPNPIEAIKPHLKGMPTDVAVELADRAREEARDWPPQIGTSKGSLALLGKESGQILALRVGLQKFHPGTTATEAERLYRQLGKDAAKEARRQGKKLEPNEAIVSRIFAVLFGHGDTVDADEDEAPKDQREAGDIVAYGFPGTPSTGDANANSA